ncbi:hypothetical protein H0H92_000054 [Tricholoma furcatifolium]|nr:hypothetical protein H0H92_000054 [Tricholoma furcatifolium]
MERKKSKHSIMFPTVLDMSPFTGARGKDSKVSPAKEGIYELRGVLLHKGSSAYHGHYEAQVFDKALNSWFQFDDETVTKIRVLGGNSRNKPIVVDDDSDENQRKPTNARKRRRVTSEDECDSLHTEYAYFHSFMPSQLNAIARYISSKDAYMLIYSRKLDSGKLPSMTNIEKTGDIPVPPSDALDVVKELNAAHDEACETYDNKRVSIPI